MAKLTFIIIKLRLKPELFSINVLVLHAFEASSKHAATIVFNKLEVKDRGDNHRALNNKPQTSRPTLILTRPY